MSTEDKLPQLLWLIQDRTKHRLVHLNQQAVTKSYRLRAIQIFLEKSRVQKNMDVPTFLAKFEDLLLRYYEDYQSEALSDDLQKTAMRELIPVALQQTVKDVIMFRSIHEDALSAVQLKTIIMERIVGDTMRPDMSDVSRTCR